MWENFILNIFNFFYNAKRFCNGSNNKKQRNIKNKSSKEHKRTLLTLSHKVLLAARVTLNPSSPAIVQPSFNSVFSTGDNLQYQ